MSASSDSLRRDLIELVERLSRERDAALAGAEHYKKLADAARTDDRKLAELRAAYTALPVNTRDRWTVEAGWIGSHDRRMAAAVRALVEPVADAPEERPAAPPLKVSVWKHSRSPALTFSLAGDSLPPLYSRVGEYELRPAQGGDRG